MKILELARQGAALDAPEELDTLLEFAEEVREALEENRLADVADLIRYTVMNGYQEAFCWGLGILEEVYGQDGTRGELVCQIGRFIPEYNEFISRLQVDLSACENDVLQIRDENGEVQSFFNILRYRTGFAHIELVTSENFDARDNDYIQYMLVCRAK